MTIAIAPDKFKGTLTAFEAADIIASAFAMACPHLAVRRYPLADGGEGTCQALTAARNGAFRNVTVRGPLGEAVTVRYGLADDEAFMEMAASSGLQLVPKNLRNPLKTSTYGLGQMMLDAIRNGVKKMVIGIGGSATNDGGAGMAEALGARFFDDAGNELHGLCGEMLPLVQRIELDALRRNLAGIRLMVASDVTNPLLGAMGTATVYAPQKGASQETVAQLEAAMTHFYHVAEPGSTAPNGCPGDGAAGGLGFGYRVFCNAEFESGAQMVIRESGLEAALKRGDIDLVITGEGCTDSQTESGKLCAELALQARRVNVPCFLLSGSVACPANELQRLFAGVFVSGIGRRNQEDTLAHAQEDLASAARSLAAAISAGRGRSHG